MGAVLARGPRPAVHERSLIKAVFLLGPTASGKTSVALALAERFPIEIVSVDSAQVYRGMDVGTAKPSDAERARVPHHLIDIVDPTDAYSAGRFREDALKLAGAIHGRGRLPVFAGGTMLYIRALTRGLATLPPAHPEVRARIDARAAKEGWPTLHAELARIDPATAARLKPMDSQRIQRALEIYAVSGKPMSVLLRDTEIPALAFTALRIALEPSDRAQLHARIEARFRTMLAAGLVEELEALRGRYLLTDTLPSMRAVGYRQAWDTLEGREKAETLEARGVAATRQLAKRQLTWLRAMDDLERYDCLRADLAEAVAARVDGFLSRSRGT
ncbi:tRNA (adenosine(37)-N6)-dimethylallyltransferase MiaA [Usitatibacter palustris]|uniref:tRNA dimethylallyltransferase n=1 Tax=Usitatibacter palustris TaxID=2732487 RepID=A0A6M4HBV8_9PROT|nr:tRNA (adenosine(37)-N6)-dimethylallyltransferase MiaA [Usitatibacter palustris]QJR15984.1 tRNA dimethylallyltransferase [Usitatibacter palustris]